MPYQLRIQPAVPKSPRKSKTQNWRNRLKLENPKKYEEIQQKAREYSNLYRLKINLAESDLNKRNISAEERSEAEKWIKRKKKNNEQARIRMKRMKERRLSDGENLTPKEKKHITRKKHDEIREKERLKKQRQRQSHTPEQKEKQNERRRELYKQKKNSEKEKIEEIQNEIIEEVPVMDSVNLPVEEQPKDQRSYHARRKASHRVKKALPNRRLCFVNTVIDVMKSASPKKKAAFREAGVHIRDELDEKIADVVTCALKGPRNSSFRKSLATSLSHMKKWRLQRAACRRFGVSRKLLQKAKKYKAGRKQISQETIDLIHTFYEENSIVLPDKKLVSKKTLKPRHILNTNISDLHVKFNNENPNHKVSSTLFYKHRPKNVKSKLQANYVGCLCEYCENIQLKIDALNKCNRGMVKDLYSLVSQTLCDKDSNPYNKPECIKRSCDSCGVNMLLETLTSVFPTEAEFEWNRWEYTISNVYSKTSKEVKKRCLITKHGCFPEFLSELSDELNSIAAHLFNKDWQHQQEKLLRCNLKEDEVLAIFDFAENFKCSYQREVQSAYYAHDSATVHPIVAYYHCSQCSSMITESCVMISNDLTHDYNLVYKFQEVLSKHLIDTRGRNITTLYRYSDGCSSQYKSKGPISDISYAAADFGYNITHSYSGTRHGKGASDGESGVVKRSASDAIMSGKAIIDTPEALFNFLKASMTKETSGTCCLPFLRSFFFITFSEVNRNRTNRSVKTVQGTRKLHSIRNVPECPGVIAVRELSCFCNPCKSNEEDRCENLSYVNKWKEIELAPKNEHHSDKEDDMNEDDISVISGNDKMNSDIDNNAGASDFSLKSGQFVLVSLSSGKSSNLYVAQIMELVKVHGGMFEYRLNYMEKGVDGYYKWPSIVDISIEAKNSIKALLPTPELLLKQSSSRLQYFCVDFDKCHYLN